jgi:hypothetical protein
MSNAQPAQSLLAMASGGRRLLEFRRDPIPGLRGECPSLAIASGRADFNSGNYRELWKKA